MKKGMTETEFRDRVLNEQPKLFDELGKDMMCRLYAELKKADDSGYYVLVGKSRKPVKIRTSRVLKETQAVSFDCFNPFAWFYEGPIPDRILSSADAANSEFDSTIEKVNPAEFDYLLYALFYSDCIEIFCMSRSDVSRLDDFSEEQHRGNTEEGGQFHINEANINFHRKLFLKKKMSYKELQALFRIPAI